jgi:predicted ATPase
MDRTVDLHFDVLRRSIEGNGGAVVKSTGDGVLATFRRPIGAVHAAAHMQRELDATSWPVGDLRVRVGVHTGECIERGGDLYGRSVNKAARIEQAAYGGQVLVSDTTATLVRNDLDDDLQLVYLGEHHFDGILDPTRVHQLSIQGLSNDHPPLRTRDLGLERLPPELTPLIGRGEALLELARDLRSHRLVSLVGPPGVGKSRLAHRVAAQEARERESGVRYVDLTPGWAPGAAIATIANVLGVRPDEVDAPADAIVRALRTSDALLVLDNCEHLLLEAAALVDLLVTTCPNLGVLVTSRERLDLPYEMVWPVRPLELPVPRASTVADVMSSAAVQLLVERAHTGVAQVLLSDEDALAISAICRRCDGLPLALELAAARLETLSPRELLMELESSIGALGPRREDESLGRPPGLLEALDASYGGLSEDEQVLLDELAVFAGPAALDAVIAVCRGADRTVRTGLDGLVRRSMLSVERSTDRNRFRLLESIRQYAAAHGRVDDDLLARHSAFFVTEAERRGAQYLTGEGVDAARAMADQFDDFRLAVQRLTAREDWADAARIVLALHAFCLFSLRPELHTWALHLDGRLPEHDPRAAELQGIVALGLWFRGDHEAALAKATGALEAAGAAEGPASTIWAHTAILNAASHIGDLDAATHHLSQLRRECYATGHPYWIINANAMEAVGLATIGLTDLAVRPAAEAVRLAEELGNPEGQYWAAYAQALALRPTDVDGAEAALDRSLAAARSNGSRFNEGNVLVEQLSIHVERGRLGAAAATALDLLAHLERAGGFGQIWEVVLLAARALADAGRDEAALTLLAAGTDRPRAPHLGIDRLLAGVHDDLVSRLGADAAKRTAARAPFLTEVEVIERCRHELEALLRD